MAHKEDYIITCMHESARKAINEDKVFNYYLFWKTESVGWQKLAKRVLREELHNVVIEDCQ